MEEDQTSYGLHDHYIEYTMMQDMIYLWFDFCMNIGARSRHTKIKII